MSSLAQRALARGLAVRTTVSKETVTLNGVEYDVPMINRTSEHGQPQSGVLISSGESSSIEMPLESLPKEGSIITDSFGYNHRVEGVRHIGHALLCRCEVHR